MSTNEVRQSWRLGIGSERRRRWPRRNGDREDPLVLLRRSRRAPRMGIRMRLLPCLRTACQRLARVQGQNVTLGAVREQVNRIVADFVAGRDSHGNREAISFW